MRAYSTLLLSRRQQLHARITITLEGQFPEIAATQPALLAQHSAEAGLIDKAVEYWLKAGQQSVARFAMTEAVAQLRRGLDFLAGMADGAARQQQELDLQITLGQALITTKGYSAPEPGEVFARARQLCEQLNRPEQLGMVLYGQHVFRLVRAELQEAEHLAKEMRYLGEALNSVMWKCFGSAYLGITCCCLGKFIDARAWFEDALSLWDPRHRALTPAINPYVANQIWFSRTLICLGYVDQARLQRDEALAEARRTSPHSLAFALCHAWYDDWAIEGMKSAEAMLRSADEIIAISSEQGFALWSGVGNAARGWYLSWAGSLPLRLVRSR